MEAMKMENILRAEKAATVKATPVGAGASVAVDQVIVEFE
jgi:propionyl-CoA carboxylase alpha chain